MTDGAQKALAQDQKQKLVSLLQACGLGDVFVETYDGDTPKEARTDIRTRAQIIITNPGASWKKFLTRKIWCMRQFCRSINFGSHS
jgi:ATP-dependent helicase YprA (DUF1998 family)